MSFDTLFDAKSCYSVTCGYTWEHQQKVYDACWRETCNYTQKQLSLRSIIRFWDPKNGKDLRMSLKNMIKYLLDHRYITEYEYIYNMRAFTPLGYNCTLFENIMYDLTPTTKMND